MTDNPAGSPLDVQLTPRFVYSGRGTKLDKELPPMVAYVEVVDVQVPVPVPTPSPLPIPELTLLNRSFYFEQENSESFDKNIKPENKLKAIEDWIEMLQKVSPILVQAVKSNYVMLNVTGYASPPGAYEYNSDKSDSRAQYVANRISRVLGTESVRINRRARGERDSKEVPGVKPNQRDSIYLKDRRVDVVIEPNDARKGMERALADINF